MHHPYRYMGESPAETVQNLGGYIRHVHVKDSKIVNGALEYRMMGDGDLPLHQMFDALLGIGYELHLPRVGQALVAGAFGRRVVFPRFADYMRDYLDERLAEAPLQKNRTGTGEYVWPKETLIDLTFPDVLDKMVEKFPDQPCFRYTELDYARTYKEFRDDVDTFARSLIAMGVKKGDHVAIWATNVPQWYITFWATTKIGAVLVTVNTAYKSMRRSTCSASPIPIRSS